MGTLFGRRWSEFFERTGIQATELWHPGSVRSVSDNGAARCIGGTKTVCVGWSLSSVCVNVSANVSVRVALRCHRQLSHGRKIFLE